MFRFFFWAQTKQRQIWQGKQEPRWCFDCISLYGKDNGVDLLSWNYSWPLTMSVTDITPHKLHNTTNSSVGFRKDLWQKTSSKFSQRCSLIARDRFLWFLWFHIHGWPFRLHVSLPLECCFSLPVSMYRSNREKTRRKGGHFGGCWPRTPRTGGCLSVTSDFSVCLCSAEVVRCRKKILYEKWPTTNWNKC